MLPTTLKFHIGETAFGSVIASGIKDNDSVSGESDAYGVTSFVYKDKKSGEGVMIDCGASPAMKRDPSPIITGLLERHNIHNVCLSHGHFDHFNGLHFIEDSNTTVYMSPLTSRYVQREWERHDRGVAPFKKRIFVPKNERFTAKDHVSMGPFKFVPILVPHSISESSMLLIMNGRGRVALHQGDAKLVGMDWQEESLVRSRLKQIGDFGFVDFMYVDNLNCHRPGFIAEESGVVNSMRRIIETTDGRIVVGVFATNLRRIKAISDIALRLQRDVEFVGSSMRFAKELLEEENGRFPPRRKKNNPVVFTSGCQGEVDSVLWREAQGEDSPLGLGKGDTVIFSSHKIPGNEQRIADTVNSLVAKGCRVIVNTGEVRGLRLNPKEVEEAFTHVSGHGQRKDVETALDLVRPRAVIPSIRRGPQIRAFQEICAERNIKILDPDDNCFVF